MVTKRVLRWRFTVAEAGVDCFQGSTSWAGESSGFEAEFVSGRTGVRNPLEARSPSDDGSARPPSPTQPGQCPE